MGAGCGSIRKMTEKMRRGLLDAVLTVSKQPSRRDRLFPDTVISFTNEDYPSESIEPHEGALAITAQVRTMEIKIIMIDNSSSVDIL